MGHEPDDVAPLVADRRDVVYRSVGVLHVAQHYLVLADQPDQCFVVAGEVPLEMVDRNCQFHSGVGSSSQDGIGGLDP